MRTALPRTPNQCGSAGVLAASTRLLAGSRACQKRIRSAATHLIDCQLRAEAPLANASICVYVQ